jgi:uncharacterized membrane protein YidH (DUF202 family)
MTQDNEHTGDSDHTGDSRDVPPPPPRDLPAPDPGLARERTSLAWTRTAIGFAALGGVVLKENVITGLIILAIAPVVWRLARVTEGHGPARDLPRVGATRLFLMSITIVAVALLCLFISIFGKSVPGALR